MSFFLKLNLRYDKIFLGKGTLKENKKNCNCGFKTNFSSFKKFRKIQFRVIDFGPTQKSMTRNTLSQNSNSAVPQNLGVPHY